VKEDEKIVRFRARVPARPATPVAALIAAAVLGLAMASALSGCGASFDARTNVPYQPAQGITDRSGDIYLIDTLVVTDEDGNGTVVARLINKQSDDDALVSISAVDSTGQTITTEPLGQPIALGVPPAADQSVQVGTDGALRLTGDNVVAGDFVKLTFTFARAAPLTIEAPVVPVGTLYGDIPVGPVETPTAGSETG
jgi:hypothetical protein